MIVTCWYDFKRDFLNLPLLYCTFIYLLQANLDIGNFNFPFLKLFDLRKICVQTAKTSQPKKCLCRWICKLRPFLNWEFNVCTLFFNIAKDQKQGPQIGKAARDYLVNLPNKLTPRDSLDLYDLPHSFICKMAFRWMDGIFSDSISNETHFFSSK